MQEFHKRVIKREQEERLNLPVILRCDKMEAIEWIKKNIPQGSYVLDIGCALGEVLDSLRDAGFNPIGIEPSITMVKRLRQRGHTVWHGTIDDIPQGSLPKISVCTAFIMLHHVPDPLGFFRAVKKLCPSSWFLISEGIYDWKCSPYPGPPRHYSVWNANSLSVVLNSGGYVVEKINTLDPVYKQPNIPFSERLLPIASSQRVVFFYRRVKFILFWPLFLWSTLRKKNKTRPFILAYAKTKK
jgi:SAM-dependent methyltransferase